ncbi:MAG: PEP-CTERM sorting domain-containing protein [Pirellulales bacterium]|nr:PEP-CTERM sorting domain-containing protein [Pirellulales bacterium]
MVRRIILLSFCALLSTWGARLRAYEATDRWNTTATNGGTGTTGTPITLTWSFADDGTRVPNGAAVVESDLIAMLDLEFGAGPGGSNYVLRPWFSIFADSFDRLGELAGLDYAYVSADDGANFSTEMFGSLGVRGDVRIGGCTYGAGSTTLASNFFPDYGEMIINTDQGAFFDNEANNFLGFRNMIMHEALHGVGLNHVDAGSSGFLLEPSITTAFDGPQLDDVLGMQRQYGDVYEKNGGNNTFLSATSLGQISQLQAAVLGQNGGATFILDDQNDFISIDDDSDVDYFSFTLSEPHDISINLRPQGASYLTGPANGTVATLDATSLNDLSLTLFGTNGVSVLGTSSVSGAGGTESLSMSLGAGTFYTRVAGSLNDVQLYELTVAVAGPAENLLWTGQISDVWDLQSTANFNNGSDVDVFANLDTVTFDDTGQEKIVNLSGSLSPAAIVVDAAGDYTFVGAGALTGGSLTLNGAGAVEIANSGNSYGGPTQINGGTLIFSGDTSAMTSAISIASGGTVIMDSSPAGGNSSTFAIQPGGTLQIGSATSNADVFPNSPVSVVNNGIIRVLDFESVTNISGSGDIVAVAELALLGNNSYTGQTIVELGGSIQPTDNMALGSTSGNTVIEAGGFFIAQDDDFGPASLVLSENFVLAGNGNGFGAMQIASGTTATLQGVVTIAAGGATVRVSGSSSAVISGAFDGGSGQTSLEVGAGSSLVLGGNTVFGTAGLVKTSSGPVTITGLVDLGGPADIQAGSLSLAGSGSVSSAVRIASGATLALAGTASWDAASALTGLGTLAGDLTISGTIAAGDSTAGTLAIDGDLTLTGSSDLQIEIGGNRAGEFDQIDVSGVVALGGNLAVSLIDLESGVFQPQLGDSFGFLDAQNGTSGAFDTLILPSLAAGLGWQLRSIGTTTSLDVVGGFTADFDNDVDVDADDLFQWEGDYGGPGSDANGDGISNGADFFAWQLQFGSGASNLASGAAVPEPATLVLVAVLTGMLSLRRFRLLGGGSMASH